MPQEGAQILSQVQALLQQFLALDYDTPAKATVEQLIPGVQQAMSDLGAGGEPQPSPTGDMRTDFSNAREGASQTLAAFAEGGPRAEEETPLQARRKKKSKAKAA